LDLWQTALPFLEDWQRQRLSPWENLKKLQARLPQWLEQLPELPDQIFDTLSQTRNSRRTLQELMDRHEARRREEKALRSSRRKGFAILALAGAALTSMPAVNDRLQDFPAAALVLLAAGIGLLVFRD
ncbi:MAG: ubiquinone biosynthesis regulatory protein kinase UbiB, partial [Pseudohongiellaceae bacterium]